VKHDNFKTKDLTVESCEVTCQK